MSDNKPNQKRDFKTAVEDAKALATVLAMEAESVFGRRTARVSGVYSKTASDMTPSKIAGLITRKQRDQLLKTLELEFEKVEGARQDASGKAKLPSALDA